MDLSKLERIELISVKQAHFKILCFQEKVRGKSLYFEARPVF